MELPFTVVFEPPSQSELRALLRMRGYWAAGLIVALTIGIAYLLSNVAHADAVAATARVPLSLGSQPAGASLVLDGRERGTTPLDLLVEPGQHRLQLSARDALSSRYAINVGSDGAAFDALLWRRQPSVTRLRPALPGAALADVRPLDDGALGLTVALPASRQQQAWRMDPRSGALQLLASSVAGRRLAFAADGAHLAYIGTEIGPPNPPLASGWSSDPPASVVWLITRAADTQAVAGWRAPIEPPEELTDVSWSPRAERLLVVSNQRFQGGASVSRAWFVDGSGQRGQSMLSVPSDIVAGSETWSPDGRWVAFVAHAGQVNALCLLGVDGTFRYVADLDISAAAPPGRAALAWSPTSQQVLFVAPHQHPPGMSLGWLQSDASHVLYTAGVDQPTPVALSDTDLDLATWREDGQLLGLSRPGGDGPLAIRLLDAGGGGGEQLLQLPLKPSGAYAATWDLQRARVLVTSRNQDGGLDYWLVRLGFEADV